MTPFENFDWSTFWEQSEYADKSYVEPPPSAETIAKVEAHLGYKLPAAYLALAARQNGGMPKKSLCLVKDPDSDEIIEWGLTGISAIGWDSHYSLAGEYGSKFRVEDWEYPDIGVYFGDCPSGGHDMFCLDYRECGPNGEPTVVHVDEEQDGIITFVAPNFEAFIRSLQVPSDDEAEASICEQ